MYHILKLAQKQINEYIFRIKKINNELYEFGAGFGKGSSIIYLAIYKQNKLQIINEHYFLFGHKQKKESLD